MKTTTTITNETIEMRKKVIDELIVYYGDIATDLKRVQEKHKVYDEKTFNEFKVKFEFLSNTSEFFINLDLEPHIDMNIFVKAQLAIESETRLVQRDFGANHLVILGYNCSDIETYKTVLKKFVDLVCMHGQDPLSISFVKMITYNNEGNPAVDMVIRENMARLYKTDKWRYEVIQVFDC